MLKYVWEGDTKALTGADIAKFVNDFNDGKLQPFLKSDPIPEPATVEGVTTLVGKNWE